MKKKLLSAICYLMFGLQALLPLGVITAYCFGYLFSLFNYTVFSVSSAVISVFAVAVSSTDMKLYLKSMSKVLFGILPFVCAANWVCSIVLCSSGAVALSMLICFTCSIVLAELLSKPLALKIFSVVLSILLIVPLGFFSLFFMIFRGLAVNTVVETVVSPDGQYYAEVIDRDKGALGGDTLIDVYENKGINAVVFSVKKRPSRVYTGEWREYEVMNIYWENNNSLIINSKEYLFE